MIAFGTVAGGAGAALTGGNFWQGAVTGLVVSGLNHAMYDFGGGGGDPPVKMKPASAYDYSQEIIDGKFTDDWNYILNGDSGNPISRARQIFERDWNQASTGEKTDFVLSATPFSLIRIGKFAVEANTLHRVIKPAILKKTPKEFLKIVGKNPDIMIKGENIFLTGAKNSPFYGKSYNTNLKALDFFKQ